MKLAFWSGVVQSQTKDKKALPPLTVVCYKNRETWFLDSVNELMLPFSLSLSLSAWFYILCVSSVMIMLPFEGKCSRYKKIDLVSVFGIEEQRSRPFSFLVSSKDFVKVFNQIRAVNVKSTVIPVSGSCFVLNIVSIHVTTWDSEVTRRKSHCGRVNQVWGGFRWVINSFAFEEWSRSVRFTIQDNHIQVGWKRDFRTFGVSSFVGLTNYLRHLNQNGSWNAVRFEDVILDVGSCTVWPWKNKQGWVSGPHFLVGFESSSDWLSVLFVDRVVKVNTFNWRLPTWSPHWIQEKSKPVY